jgi:hypothetical protein
MSLEQQTMNPQVAHADSWTCRMHMVCTRSSRPLWMKGVQVCVCAALLGKGVQDSSHRDSPLQGCAGCVCAMQSRF